MSNGKGSARRKNEDIKKINANWEEIDWKTGGKCCNVDKNEELNGVCKKCGKKTDN